MTIKERLNPTPSSSNPAANKEKKSAILSAAAVHSQPIKTRIIIQYDVGYPNALYIRGYGADLSWEKGIELKNISRDTWVWETSAPFTSCEFKILINDTHYEIGDNHMLSSGDTLQYTPQFSY